MRSRPEIELSVPKSARPGEPVRVSLVLRSASETPIDWIEVSLVGISSARLPDQSAYASERTFHTATERLREGGTLKEGEHTLEVSLDLPAEMPASYVGSVADVRYSIKARVSIPWWPDAVESADLLVRPVPRDRPGARPATTATPGGDLPILEMAIDDRSFMPGDVITGAVAIGEARAANLGGMDLSLAGYERLRLPALNGRETLVEANRHAVFVNLDRAREGAAMNFRIPIPRDAFPSFDEGLFALEWIVEAHLDVGFSRSVIAAIPVVIGPYARPLGDGGALQRGGAEPRAAAGPPKKRPKIGSDRWRHVWRKAGAAAGLALDADDLRLTGVIHGYEASIAPGTADGKRGKRGSITAELKWPSLGIGLEIGKAGLSLFQPEGAFAEKYKAKSRYSSQAEGFLTPALKKALLSFESIEVDDNGARLTLRGTAHDADWIAWFLQIVLETASAASEAALQIPPPPPMASMRAAWQAFADELGGRLAVGSMSVLGGHLDGGAFTIETCFEGKNGEGPEGGPLPSSTLVSLSLDPKLPSALDVDRAEALASAPPAVRAAVAPIVASIRQIASALRVSEELIEIDLPAPLADPSSARDVMRAMLALEERLRGDHRAGPYR